MDPTNLLSPDLLNHLDGYLDNLANAAMQDKTTLAQLVETNAKLTVNVTALTASLASLTAAYTLLANKQAAAPSDTGTRTARHNTRYEQGGYCWTHGYKLSKGHTSATCSGKATGHKDTATRANTMGGSTRNKNWDA